MKIEIICPLYNAEKCVLELNKSLLKQRKVKIDKISYVLTESTDNTAQILKDNKIEFSLIKKNEFSHSLTREKIAMKSNSNILVFITQDIIIKSDNWLYELVSPIINLETVACYSRQISKYNNIEKYIREKNYPADSFIVSKEDIQKLGLKTFFFSDASSAVRTDVFKELNGYDGKNLVINEDMYIAYKIIMRGYKIKYCADSVVYHSHRFSLKNLYNRYYAIGVFLKQNPNIDSYNTIKVGCSLAKYVLKRAICQFNLPVLFSLIPNMLARWFGLKNGKKQSSNNSKFDC